MATLQPTSPQSATSAADPAMTFGRVAAVIGVGVALWFLGIFQIRWAGSTGALSNGMTPLVYGLIVVATIPFIWITPRLLGLSRAYSMHCGAIMGATASLLDGMAVRWTHWYAVDPRLLAESAATLLWAVGVAVGLGLAMSVRSPEKA